MANIYTINDLRNKYLTGQAVSPQDFAGVMNPDVAAGTLANWKNQIQQGLVPASPQMPTQPIIPNNVQAPTPPQNQSNYKVDLLNGVGGQNAQGGANLASGGNNSGVSVADELLKQKALIAAGPAVPYNLQKPEGVNVIGDYAKTMPQPVDLSQNQSGIGELFAPLWENLYQQQRQESGSAKTLLSKLGMLLSPQIKSGIEGELATKQKQDLKNLSDLMSKAYQAERAGASSRDLTRINALIEEEKTRQKAGVEKYEGQLAAGEKNLQFAQNYLQKQEAGTREDQKLAFDMALESTKLELQQNKQQLDLIQAMDKASKPDLQTVSGNLVAVYPDGTSKVIFEAPEAIKQANLDIHYEENAKGEVTQILTDPVTGKTIVTKLGDLGKGFKATTTGGQGITPPGIGTGNQPVAITKELQAYVDNPSLLSSVTPTKRAQIIKALSEAGIDVVKFTTEKLSAGQKDQIAQFDDLVRNSNTALTIIDELKINTGVVASNVSKLQAVFGGNPEFTQYRSVIDNMGSQLLKLRSGAAVTPQEFERIKGFIPNINDDEKTARKKVLLFNQEMTTARKNYVERSTATSNQLLESVQQKEESMTDEQAYQEYLKATKVK